MSEKSGLDALIPKGHSTASGYRELPVDSISSNVRQPREHFDEEALESLVASVALVGVLQPIAVRPKGADTFELISGERRWRAAKQAGLGYIPAVIRQIGDEDSLEHALMENLHRSDLNPLEEAVAYQHLIDDFGLSQEEIAKRVGKSRAAVANSLRLTKLPVELQSFLVSGELTSGHARSLITIADKKSQIALAKKVVKEGWSVRQLENHRKKTSGTKPKESASESTSKSAKDAMVMELEKYLSERLSTRVDIKIGKKGTPGRATIEFADLEDLERIVSTLLNNQKREQ